MNVLRCKRGKGKPDFLKRKNYLYKLRVKKVFDN